MQRRDFLSKLGMVTASYADWNVEGKIDHDITRVISGISDTALHPKDAAKETLRILSDLFKI